MKSIRNQYGKMSQNNVLDKCENCDKINGHHTTIEAVNCKRALANSV